jgi:hypothetical protein
MLPVTGQFSNRSGAQDQRVSRVINNTIQHDSQSATLVAETTPIFSTCLGDAHAIENFSINLVILQVNDIHLLPDALQSRLSAQGCQVSTDIAMRVTRNGFEVNLREGSKGGGGEMMVCRLSVLLIPPKAITAETRQALCAPHR